MGTAAISYNSLHSAAGEAREVSGRLTSYADGLNSNVYRKLMNYSGVHTGNINSASRFVNNKVNILRDRAAAYRTYASDLEELTAACRNTDRAVRGIVSRLTADFKRAHGIRNSVVENTLNRFLTDARNFSFAGRWLNDGQDKIRAGRDYLKQAIEDWWDYRGGKEFVTGLLEIAKKIAGTTIMVLGALASGSMVFLIAGVILGVIQAINEGVDLGNEIRAYWENSNGDPARGRRLSDENTVQDFMRNESEENVSFWHKAAGGIDLTVIICECINQVGSCRDFVKNAYNWTKGTATKLKDLKLKDILTFDNIKAFGQKLKLQMNLGLKDIKAAVKFKGLSGIKGIAKNISTDFMNSLREKYSDFSEMKKGLGSFKNLISLTGKFIDPIEIKGSDISSFIISNVSTFENFNLVNDISKIVNKMGKIGKMGEDLIDKSIGKKLSFKSQIHISIPKIPVPEIRMAEGIA